MSKSGYSLIIIGLILLAYNYSLIDFSILSAPLALPIIFIIAGIFKIIKNLLKPNDLLEVLSSLIGIILFLAIILNIFNFPLIMIPRNAASIVNLNASILTASFASIDFSADINTATVSYESDDKSYLESAEYSQNYSIINSFSESAYDFSNFLVSNLFFDNNFAESQIGNLAYIGSSRLSNKFGELIIRTGDIIGEKELILSNSFGDVKIFIDPDASYDIESDNSFGSIKNNVGLLSSDYSTAQNKIKIIIGNSFGTVELSRQ
jgi:hypothetical protein